MRFQYRTLTWASNEDEAAFVERLNAAGADGWQAVGLTTRSVSVPAPGMGADAIPEIVVLLVARSDD